MIDGVRYSFPGDFALSKPMAASRCSPRQHVHQHRRRRFIPKKSKKSSNGTPRFMTASSSVSPMIGSANVSLQSRRYGKGQQPIRLH